MILKSWPRFSGLMVAIALISVSVQQDFAAETKSGEKKASGKKVIQAGAKEWRDPVTKMQFVWVPDGSFEMGCHAKAGKCGSDEKHVRTVRLDGFWLGKHEVTQGQWKKIMGGNPSNFKKGGNYPVESVSWNDAQDFIRRLNSRSSVKFRLPSEAQWEYACRAGGKAIKYSWGNQGVGSGGARANFMDRNMKFGLAAKFTKPEIKGVDDGYAKTAPVGSYAPNALGLHDMLGNVGEWVQDKYTDYSKVVNKNPIYERSGGDIMFRGGGWTSIRLSNLRCSRRSSTEPSDRSYFWGFRLLKTNISVSAQQPFAAETMRSKYTASFTMTNQSDEDIPFEMVIQAGHNNAVTTIAFSPDGQIIATGSGDKTIKLWDLQGRLLRTLRGFEKPVEWIAFHPKGMKIAGSSRFGTVRLWDVRGELLKTFVGKFGKGLAFGADGRTLAVQKYEHDYDVQPRREYFTLIPWSIEGDPTGATMTPGAYNWLCGL